MQNFGEIHWLLVESQYNEYQREKSIQVCKKNLAFDVGFCVRTDFGLYFS